MKTNPKSPTAGGAVIIVLIVLALAVALVGTSVLITSSQNRLAARQREVMESVAAADGALEYAYAVWRDMIRDSGTTAPNSKELADDIRFKDLKLADNSGKSPAKELAATEQRISAFSISATDPWGATSPSGGDGEPVSYDVTVDDFPGWKGKANFYKATATATGTRTLVASRNTTATVSRYFSITRVPLFQSAIFYMDDLEIHPGALMTIDGLVHSNKSIYASGYAKLQFLDNVSYGIKFHEGAPEIGDWDGSAGGGATDPTITPYWSDNLQTGTSTARPKQLSGPLDRIEPFGKTPQTLFNTTDKNKNNDGYHEWIEPPVSGGADPAEIADQRLYNKAELRIEIDSSKPVTDSNRIKVTNGSGSSVGQSDLTRVKAAIDAGTTIYDWREGGGVAGAASGSVKVTSLDMKVMNTALIELKKNNKFMGVMYVRDVASTKGAIRLKNGAHLAMDLTVASQNPVYIQGDYNTGTGADPTKPHDPNLVPSNNGGNVDGTEPPIVPGYPKKSAAVIADAVVVLSNNWNDANSAKSLGNRLATHTTVNAAFMAGDVPTNANNNGSASGGAHNFPRFLEAWYDFGARKYIDLTYHGSMVQAFQSNTFTGKWSTGQVYIWPNRKWAFEKLFTSKPPPGSVMGTTSSRGRWERL